VRVKTSNTLPDALLRRIDSVDSNRSALLEREARDRRDVDIINRNAARLNRQAKETLEYQQIP
jgi:hypothetical protein